MTLIGDAIKRQRTACGMTSKRLAGETGLSQQYVGDVQLGRRIPTLETMLLFSNVFPDADTGRWAWLVIRDLYGDGFFSLLWDYSQTIKERTALDGDAEGSE